ncbi:hypothetical protein [Flavobacterium soyae]|uniref:Uncharacterized protein n=1 Tax=Flavobacterium soyae TaxID=2903098 RepID=A0ABZ2UGU2_9FLAO
MGLIMFLVGKHGVKDKIKRDLGNYDYIVGTIEVYFYRVPVAYNATFSSITYSYIVNNVKYVNNYDAMFYKLPYSPNVNDKFVVVYNKNDPQKSILLGDYPIKTEEDFNVFLKKYKNVKLKF